MKLSLLVLSLIVLTGCYRAGEEDDFRAVSVTNNPHLIPQQDSKPLGGVPY